MYFYFHYLCTVVCGQVLSAAAFSDAWRTISRFLSSAETTREFSKKVSHLYPNRLMSRVYIGTSNIPTLDMSMRVCL